MDRFDQNIEVYRNPYRGKEWWSSIFTRLIDACMQNACQLLHNYYPAMSQARSEEMWPLTTASTMTRCQSLQASQPARCDDQVRVHWKEPCDTIEQIIKLSRLRRRGEQSKCEIGLCLRCFETYHTLNLKGIHFFHTFSSFQPLYALKKSTAILHEKKQYPTMPGSRIRIIFLFLDFPGQFKYMQKISSKSVYKIN